MLKLFDLRVLLYFLNYRGPQRVFVYVSYICWYFLLSKVKPRKKINSFQHHDGKVILFA